MKNIYFLFIRHCILSFLFLLVVWLFTFNSACAFDINVQPRVTTGIIDYTVEFDPSSSTQGVEFTFKDEMPFVGIGTTFFAGRFYLDLYAQKSIEGKDGFSTQVYRSPEPPAIPSHSFINFDTIVKFDRSDFTISAGYSLTDNLSLFLGYRLGRSELEADGRATIYLVDDGTITGVPGLVLFDEQIGSIDFDYENHGPFLGSAFGWKFEDKGSLSFNIAIAYLKGENEQSGDLVSPISGPGNLDLETSGDSLGISLGVAWRGHITERLGYSFSIDGHKFDFEADNAEQPDFSEMLYTIKIGLSYAL